VVLATAGHDRHSVECGFLIVVRSLGDVDVDISRHELGPLDETPLNTKLMPFRGIEEEEW